MLKSEFWRDLSEKFRTMNEGVTLAAEWSAFDETWTLTGASSTAMANFKTLAARGAVNFAPKGAKDPFGEWLYKLRAQGPGFKEMWTEQLYQEREVTRQVLHGRIPNVCTHSANLCMELEYQAITEEFNQKNKYDAANSYLLRRAQKRLLKTVQSHASVTGWKPLEKQPTPSQPMPQIESVGAQLNRLRDEARISVDRLAELVQIDRTNVMRHLNDKSKPHLRNLGSYERAFSKILKREVVIKNKPSKRH